MNGALAFVGGVALGMVLAFRLKPAPESSCCVRFAAGVRDKVGELCGDFGDLCQKAGDASGLFDHTASILDFFGVDP